MMYHTAVFVFYNELKLSVKWWKIAIFLIATVIMIIPDVKMDDLHFLQMCWLSWIPAFIKPIINKLFYLLPGNSKSRMLYYKWKVIGGVLLYFLWFFVIYIGNALQGDFSLMDVLYKVITEDIVIILVMFSFTLYFGIPNKDKKKSIWKVITAIVCTIYIIVHYIILTQILSDIELIIVTIIAYFCVIPLVYWSFQSIKNSDISYENNRNAASVYKSQGLNR